MTAQDFCKLSDEEIEALTLKQMKEIIKYFRSFKYYSHYFEGYSNKKCKQTLGYFLQRAKRKMAIDEGYR